MSLTQAPRPTSYEELERLWTSATLSTAPANRSVAEASVARLYELLGYEPPRRLAWGDGPVEIITMRERLWPHQDVGASILPMLNEKLAHANASFKDSVRSDPIYWRRHSLLDVYGGLWHAIGALVDQDTAQLRAGLWRRRLTAWFTGARRPAAWRTLGTGSRSQFDAIYLSSQSALYRTHGMHPERSELLEALALLVSNAGWIVPHQHVCWLGERPELLKVDIRGRLHGERGPALRYRDGWEVHAWKGVRIPAWLTEQPEAICVGGIDRERDPFVRRCMIEVLTPASYIALGGARPVARDDTGVLWQKSWALDTWAAVEVTNGSPEPDGTFKQYFLQVPPEMRTPRQAVAWTYGMSEAEYARLTLRT